MNHQYSNRLATESSPYLLMHAHNPVDWFPWGEEAFTKARTENKLVIVSIGYAACHWCHVMEHESFSDPEVAQIMNNHFVSIKVDREERPDIDSIYMNAVQIISGQGGWPLNAIILPNGKPVYAVTYLPRGQWMNLLSQIQQLHETYGEQLIEQAQEITHRIQLFNSHFINQPEHSQYNADTIHASFQNLIKIVDFTNGGLGSAPKFPMPVVFEYLLHYYNFSKEPKALEAVTLTLDRMAMGGLYDQIGGGFARYSTDNYWKVPHFEKMLYDNAQLVSLYCHAYKLTKHVRYAQIIKETLGFIEREMTSEEAGFYSAIDADSEGKEGRFYVWEYKEIKQILNEAGDFILDYFSVTQNGNWEPGKNILFRTLTDEAFIAERGLTPENFNKSLHIAKTKLLNHRNLRVKPLTDTKIITSWNALMIIACLDAYSALGDRQYLTMAINNADLIVRKLLNGNTLYRNYKDGKRYTNAKLDDYAYAIKAFISLYQTTFNEAWLEHASHLTEITLRHFHDVPSGMFFYTSDLDEALISRQYEIPDQVIPSSNSIMALNLFYLGAIYSKADYTQLSEKMLLKVRANIEESPSYFANWAILLLLFLNSPYEVALVGENCLDLNIKLNEHFLPNAIIIGTKQESTLPLLHHKLIENQTSIYICKDKVCQLPITDLEQAIKTLDDKLKL